MKKTRVFFLKKPQKCVDCKNTKKCLINDYDKRLWMKGITSDKIQRPQRAATCKWQQHDDRLSRCPLPPSQPERSGGAAPPDDVRCCMPTSAPYSPHGSWRGRQPRHAATPPEDHFFHSQRATKIHLYLICCVYMLYISNIIYILYMCNYPSI